MKLLCINDKPIVNHTGGISDGKGLKKGQTYEALNGMVHSDHGRDWCYVIPGMGKRMAQRFERLDNESYFVLQEPIVEKDKSLSDEELELSINLTV